MDRWLLGRHRADGKVARVHDASNEAWATHASRESARKPNTSSKAQIAQWSRTTRILRRKGSRCRCRNTIPRRHAVRICLARGPRRWSRRYLQCITRYLKRLNSRVSSLRRRRSRVGQVGWTIFGWRRRSRRQDCCGATRMRWGRSVSVTRPRSAFPGLYDETGLCAHPQRLGRRPRRTNTKCLTRCSTPCPPLFQ